MLLSNFINSLHGPLKSRFKTYLTIYYDNLGMKYLGVNVVSLDNKYPLILINNLKIIITCKLYYYFNFLMISLRVQ